MCIHLSSSYLAFFQNSFHFLPSFLRSLVFPSHSECFETCVFLPQCHAKLATSQITFSQHCPINSPLGWQRSINISVIDSHRADNIHTMLPSAPPTVLFLFAEPVSEVYGLPFVPTEMCRHTAGFRHLSAFVVFLSWTAQFLNESFEQTNNFCDSQSVLFLFDDERFSLRLRWLVKKQLCTDLIA